MYVYLRHVLCTLLPLPGADVFCAKPGKRPLLRSKPAMHLVQQERTLITLRLRESGAMNEGILYHCATDTEYMLDMPVWTIWRLVLRSLNP